LTRGSEAERLRRRKGIQFIEVQFEKGSKCTAVGEPLTLTLTPPNVSLSGERFVPETFESGYKITMRLTIYEVDIQDFGAYRCVAKNSLGDTDGAIKLYRKYWRK